MATENGPNLATAVKAIERLMDDTCQIWDPAGRPDDNAELDELSGALVQTTADQPLYSGKCMVGSASGFGVGAHPGEEGGRYATTSRYTLAIPISEDVEVPVGARVDITSSRRDPKLVGVRFRVTDVVVKTFAVARRMQMDRVVP